MGSDPDLRAGVSLGAMAIIFASLSGYGLATGGVWLWASVAGIALSVFFTAQGLRLARRELAIALDQAESFALGDPSIIVNRGALSQWMTRGIERFSAERRDAVAQAQFQRAILDRLPTPVVGLQADSTIIALNAAANCLLGSPKLSAVNAQNLLGGDLVAAFDGARNGVPPETAKISSLSGMRRHRLASAQIATPGGPLIVVALTDIEAELEGAELSAWRTQARILTHEVMNGLTPVISLAQSAASAPVNEATRDTLAVLERRASHLFSFVERYREVAHPLNAELRATSIAELLADAVGAAASNTEVVVEPSGMSAHLDPALATRAIANLVKNAREAIAHDRDGKVRVHAWRAEDSRLVIDVDDNGPGFTDDATANLYQPFFTTKADGMGIGLAVTRQVALAHKGTLSLMPSPLGGARLRVVL